MLKKWTKEEDNILISMYSDISNKELSELMDRSIESIRKRANRLSLYKDKDFEGKPPKVLKPIKEKRAYNMWGDTSNIKDIIISLLDEGKSYTEVAIELGTTEASVQYLVRSLDLTNKYSEFDKVWVKLIELCNSINYTVISEKPSSSHDKFTYICDKGHEHSSHIKNFIHKNYRCPICSGAHSSQVEKEILEFIKNNYTGWIIENDRSILEGKELDIVLPDLGLAFEYNGVYWHSEQHVDKYYHINKTNQVNEFGYQLIHIYEDDWVNKKELIQSKILSLLGKSYKIPARKCIVKGISYPKEFLDNNHLQGSGSPTKYNYGLFFNEELIAVMTFSKPRFNTQYDFELIRYCSLSGITVVGGASKLLKYFRKNNVGSIISYSNRSWSNGKLYKTLGFKYLHTSGPNYKYYKGLSNLSRYECQKHKLKEKFPNSYKDELTEREILHLEKYLAVYDSGNDVWILNDKSI